MSDNTTKKFFKEVGITVLCAIIISIIVRLFFLQAFYVPSESMENTLMPNDRIVASKITTNIGGVKRGEVIVFKDPGGWLPTFKTTSNPLRSFGEFVGVLPSEKGDSLVKRAIGIGGDHVSCCNARGQIVLNGIGLVEPYVKTGPGTDQVTFDIIVPPDYIFVMGDNRSQSADSRYHLEVNNGAVPVGNVIGRAVLKVWPVNSWGVLDIPDTFNNPALDLNNK